MLPRIRTAGFDGYLVTFAESLSEPANRAALAFRAALEGLDLAGVNETSTSLVSTYLRFDPLWKTHPEMQVVLEELLTQQDWYAAELPSGRRLWRVPTAFGSGAASQLAEAAAAAGLTEQQAINSLSQSRVRVQTIGFAPGMPYLGELPAEWDIPRQTQLTAQVPAGGLCVAIRQLVLFPVATPTGWRNVGQTGFRLFRPEADEPFVLRPGDEVMFDAVTTEQLAAMCDGDANGGATSRPIS